MFVAQVIQENLLKEKDQGRVRLDASGLKEECCIVMEGEAVRIRIGLRRSWNPSLSATEKSRSFLRTYLNIWTWLKKRRRPYGQSRIEGGSLSDNWAQEDGQRKYRMGNGAYKSGGWLVDGGKWCHLGTNGAMVGRACTPGGHWVNDRGVWGPYHR